MMLQKFLQKVIRYIGFNNAGGGRGDGGEGGGGYRTVWVVCQCRFSLAHVTAVLSRDVNVQWERPH